MIKAAIEYIVGLGTNKLEEIAGQTFSTQRLHLVEQATPATLTVNSLSGLVEYLQSGFDGDDKLMVHVISPTEVLAFGTLNRDQARNKMIKATAMLPEFSFDRWYDTESFNIKLQSCFVSTYDRDIMLKVVGNIQEEQVKTVGDNGVSQSVTARTGVASVAEVKVPNPVVIKPYRTFVEVEQPASDFIFRMQSGPKCAIFEADGGKWQLEAMQNIKAYLEEKLKDKIESGKIFIIA